MIKASRRVMRRFRINEISAVDMPAQEGAQATIFKRKDIEGAAGNPLAKDLTGASSAVAEDLIGNVTREKTMSEDKIRELEVQLAKAQSLLAMDADTRGYYDALKPKAQEAFLAKAATEQKAEAAAAIAKAADLKTVVYTDANGVAYTKADDTRLVELAKNNDLLMAGIRAEQAKVAEAELAKRASELAHLPGTDAVKLALLKSIDGIADEAVRTEALAVLKAKDAALAPAFEMVGTVAKADTATAADALDRLAADYAKANSVSKARAMAAVLDTAAGRELYNKSLGDK